MSLTIDFEHLKVHLEDIKSATNDFSDVPIGIGGFGKVYKGELSLPNGRRITVAFKRLDRHHGQGDVEFWKEIMMLSQCRHENLVSLLHFCNDDNERILVYEYASRGSLDRYLADPTLPWIQRLKICLGAARGLNYLHDPLKTQQRILHRDIKSSNILLDDKWTAKVSDFGLSKLGPANQQHTYLVSNVVGTPGYCDPLYWEVGCLSKESDVFSFGVVLFEMMCGRLCYEYRDGDIHILVPRWRQCYADKKLDEIILHSLKEQIDPDSLITFSNIAYRCLEKKREDRPTMVEIIKQLEIALDKQEMYENMDLEEITKIASLAANPLVYQSRHELLVLVSKGILLNDDKTWVSINRYGETLELISAKECVFTYPDHIPWQQQFRRNELRFKVGPCILIDSDFEIQVGTRFLTPHVVYTINLVYVRDHGIQQTDRRFLRLLSDTRERIYEAVQRVHIPFKYKLDEETEYSKSCVAQKENRRLGTELYQFRSYRNNHDFRIQFSSQTHGSLLKDRLVLEGIEFRPVKYEKDEILEDENNEEIEKIEINWEEKLPGDWSDIIRWTKKTLKWNTKKELYHLLRKGFFIDDIQDQSYKKWFSISKDAKKRHMLPASAFLLKEPILMSLCGRKTWKLKSDPNSRFGTVAECCRINSFAIECPSESKKLLSDKTTYACYLVYKLPKEHSAFEGIVQIDSGELIYLVTPPHTPVIRDEESRIPLKTRRIKGHPKLRKDGWMEIQISEDISELQVHRSFSCRLSSYDKWNFTGLLVQGMEFRPAKVTFKPS